MNSTAVILDNQNLLLLSGLAHLLLAGTLYFFGNAPGTRHLTRLWAASQLLIGGSFMLALSSGFAHFVWLHSIINAGEALGESLMAFAVGWFFSYRLRWLMLFTIAHFFWQLFLGFLGWPEHIRLAAAVIPNVLLQLFVFSFYGRQWRAGSLLVRYLTVVNAAVVICYVIRVLESLAGDENYHFNNSDIGQHLGMLAVYVSGLVNGFGFLLLLKEHSDAELSRLATLDSLTETLLRRSFIAQGTQQLAIATRDLTPASLLILDIDHFKRINDVYGHQTGDVVLCGLADTLRKNLRGGDMLGRWGGEEFALFLPNTNLNGATELAQRLNTQLADTAVSLWQLQFNITVSIGAIEFQTDETLEHGMMRADNALYRAKDKGRNRVEVG